MEKINDYLYVIREVTEPELAADSLIIKGKSHYYLFDCGNNPKAVEEINALNIKYAFASHFHPDHIKGLKDIKCEKLYISKHTSRKIDGIVVNELEVEDGIEFTFKEIPSPHSQGSCILTINNEITLLGDAVYMMKDMYNVTKLKDLIDTLRNLDTQYFIMSHKSERLLKKAVIIAFLERIYSKREPGSPFIKMSDNAFFK
ncbi:MAG: MBL fold metallo-hydrolase [Bacilli bacterium]|nr:MBL fold metallo-hydrolase [Bacilli bacterium]